MRSALLTACCLLAWLLLLPPAATAHPHIFVDCSATAVFDEHGLKGFEQQWLFDEMFTMGMVQDYDADGNGAFDDAEAARYEQEIFSILKDYNYLTVLRVDGEDRRPATVSDFRLSIKGGKLCYRFFTPCDVPLDGRTHTVGIAVFDQEYYADMILPLDACTVRAPQGLAPRLGREAAEELTYWGFIVPEFITFTFTAS